MTSQLFRSQAIRAKTQPSYGPVLLVTPVGSGLLATGVFFLATLIIIFLLVGEYRARDTVRGIITTTEANVSVHAQVTGVVAEVLVAEGEEVSRHQPLIRLDTARPARNGTSTESALLAALNRETAGVEEQMRQSELLTSDQRRVLEQRIRVAHAQLERIEKQRVIVQEQKSLAAANSSRFAQARHLGHGSVAALETARTRYLNVELRQNELLSEQLREHESLRKAQLELRQLPLVESSRRTEREGTLQQLQQRVVNTLAQQSANIVAPISGRVSGLNVRKGQTLTPGQTALMLLPVKNQYYAELFVPTSAMGFVQPNAQVQIRYDAFPHQKFGIYTGRITEITGAAIHSGSAGTNTTSHIPSYRLHVALNRQSINVYGESRSLRAGMTLQADIMGEQRTIIEWIFDPLLSATTKI